MSARHKSHPEVWILVLGLAAFAVMVLMSQVEFEERFFGTHTARDFIGQGPDARRRQQDRALEEEEKRTVTTGIYTAPDGTVHTGDYHLIPGATARNPVPVSNPASPIGPIVSTLPDDGPVGPGADANGANAPEISAPGMSASGISASGLNTNASASGSQRWVKPLATAPSSLASLQSQHTQPLRLASPAGKPNSTPTPGTGSSYGDVASATAQTSSTAPVSALVNAPFNASVSAPVYAPGHTTAPSSEVPQREQLLAVAPPPFSVAPPTASSTSPAPYVNAPTTPNTVPAPAAGAVDLSPSLPNALPGSRFAAMAKASGARLPQESDPISAVVTRFYGATFVATPPLKLPPRAMFDKPGESRAYQKTIPVKRVFLNGYTVSLQNQAADALMQAQKEAVARKLKITPAGSVASLRSYEDTSHIWVKYLEKGLDYWVKRKKITAAQAREILASPPRKQLSQVIALEQKGLYLHANHIHSIMNLCAPPGSSQHISGLALDIEEHQNGVVRTILNKHGWYQTVAHDFPHFIYLGRPISELPQLGLTSIYSKGRQFWVPDVTDTGVP